VLSNAVELEQEALRFQGLSWTFLNAHLPAHIEGLLASPFQWTCRMHSRPLKNLGDF
jgi:hypothetical protein